jgi:hypothetical protein
MTALMFGLLGSAAASSAPVGTAELQTGLIISDRPLVGPYSRAAGWPSVGPTFGGQGLGSWGTQVSDQANSQFFYAPGAAPRRDAMRIKRVDGRLMQTCE